MTRNQIPLFILPLLAAGCSAESRYERILNHIDSAGAQLAVVEAGGGTWSGAAGLADGQVEVTEDTAFLIGSNTKVITSAVVLQLVEEGHLELDDPASRWVPQLREDVTVRDLLQHTSGMGEYFDNEVLAADDGAGKALSWTPEELIALGQEVRDDGPQEEGTYANTNFIALGRVVEAIEGRPYDVIVQERVFDTLEMEHAGIVTTGETAPGHLAQGEGGAWGVLTRYDASVGWASGSAYATASELAGFYEAVFQADLYGPEILAEQLDGKPADLGFSADGMETAYGLGMMVVTVDGQTIHGHLGRVDGFTSLAISDPETGAIAVVLTNASEVDVVGPAMKALRVAASQLE